MRIDRRIGDDPEELKAVADAVVRRGEPIVNAEIKSLLELIEAVQAHPDAERAPPREGRPKDWSPTNAPTRLTELDIRGGVVLDAALWGLDVRVALTCSAQFAHGAHCEEVSFAGQASFKGARFAQDSRFDGATFSGDAQFSGASFSGAASFSGTEFAGDAYFDDAEFVGDATFEGASFAAIACFNNVRFLGDASFIVQFGTLTLFEHANFACDAGFAGTTFLGPSSFRFATFGGLASFYKARFDEEVLFGRATFAGSAYFQDAIAARGGSFSESSLLGEADGDFRLCNVRTALFAEQAREYQEQRADEEGGATTTVSRRLSAGSWRSSQRWPRRDFGWQLVRTLGQLAILNRVSFIALIAVPVIVAFWPAVRAAAGAYHRYAAESHAAMDRLVLEVRRVAADGTTAVPDEMRQRIAQAADRAAAASDRWYERTDGFVNESPHIGATLAFTFLAAVAVTVGLLVYQVFAPEEVRKHDEDAFIDRAHQRYPENAPDRDDGLRRAIEHLEQIAQRRPDRHKSFVSHHGDTIWVPPRDKIEWFNDPHDNDGATQAPCPVAFREPGDEPSPEPQAAANSSPAPTSAQRNPPEAAEPRPVALRGAERRRIVIEEGARAEYWLKSREKIAAAWISFGLYMIGIAFLLTILGIQIHRVLDAAGWLTTAQGAP